MCSFYTGLKLERNCILLVFSYFLVRTVFTGYLGTPCIYIASSKNIPGLFEIF